MGVQAMKLGIAAGMVNEDCGMPLQRNDGQGMVRSTGDREQDLLLLGKEVCNRGDSATLHPGTCAGRTPDASQS